MFNPLALEINNHLQLSSTLKSEKKLYICQQILNFTDAQASVACRYQLLRKSDEKEIWLEVKKDRAHNYQLFYYEKVQELEYNPSFLALVGTSTIGYQNPNETEQTIYNRIPKKGESIMPIKHLVSEDELPENPKEEGYSKDGNGNWYFMTRRSEGTLKNFGSNLKKRSWEYKNEQTRLLIEMQDENNALTDIIIYEGREIERKNLKKISTL
ncbi:MAG TPA: hypothetical protein EYH01_05460 [Campylobacterales bacterium]|nr:hypothetical protein [Campylobacterales bacterium]HIP59859.1 hypothetical protein [Campylobacterales bacterium]